MPDLRGSRASMGTETNSFDDPVSRELVPGGEGTVLGGRFKLLRFIGSGSVGAVYEAYDSNRSERIAIKLFFPALAEDAAIRKTLLEAIRLNSNLKHPGITRVFEAHEVDGMLCQAMELEKRGSLREWLNGGENGRRVASLAQAAQWIRQIARTLEAVSATSLHLAIKPENLFLQEDGTLRTADFGFLRCLDRRCASFTTLIASGVSYLPPEVLGGAGKGEAMSQADQFSVAAVYYELLTGVPPVGTSESLRRLRNEIPSRLEQALERALSSDPEDRFPTLASFSTAVRTANRYPQWVRRSLVSVAAVGIALLTWGSVALVFPDSTISRLFQMGVSSTSTEEVAAEAQSLWDQTVLLMLRCDEARREIEDRIAKASVVDFPAFDSGVGETSYPAIQRWAIAGWTSADRNGVQGLLNTSRRELGYGNWYPVVASLTEKRDSVREQQGVLQERGQYLDRLFECRALAVGLAGLEGSTSPVEEWTRFVPPLETGPPLSEQMVSLLELSLALREKANSRFEMLDSRADQARQELQAKVGSPVAWPKHLGDPGESIREARSLSGPEHWNRKGMLYREARERWARWNRDFDRLPEPGANDWENSLGMRFVELKPGLQISVFETRLMDYESFIQHSGYDADRHWRWLHDEFVQESPFEPVVNLVRDNCEMFCEWLTSFERANGIISATHTYRLPTAEEWSAAAGDSRDLDQVGVPLPSEVRLRNNRAGAEDGFEFTAPVGRFLPNWLGLYDIEGNVAEWCSDPVGTSTRIYDGFVRGGSWRRARVNRLGDLAYPATRHLARDLGFRIVLEDRR